MLKSFFFLHSWWFKVERFLLLVSLSLAIFCIVYLEWFCGIGDYDNEYPPLAPITTAVFIAASGSFNIALWPVWSFITPVILFTQFMEVVMVISLLGWHL
ncbi:transmembrane protein 128 [Huso huso]|uniref:Transmembrane protein 128 n=1 Tax=Huso huso TaxID=61971 RepID=A0ABR1A9N3_HUSHU